MNPQLFVNQIGELNLPELTLQAALIDDVIGSILRIHLVCEQLLESWICAACNQGDFFGDGNKRVRINFETKLNISRNVGLPAPLYNSIRIINKIRNEVAHDHYFKDIPNDKIRNLVNFLDGYRLDCPTDKHSDEMPMKIFNEDGSVKSSYSFNDPDTPNKIKLFTCFIMLQTKLFCFIGKIHNDQQNPLQWKF
ncbi:hypothetical protein KKI90_10275 [Xenorhabdus bovienii]|uniref:hypothetical protein n=1 Tax=Xenorhabdus bovienii TaxID=40576 RepID=UPI00237C83D4|nr:hypothetical protein [Xenorhabdus bovienii]MDE1486771.1 hypothetical protein [Xenorhabdus bovienii]MDE9477323.1 hypothetical protein [Xenorhabdus bovienii]MDE9530204.1 hypothetical protein [Xenorhabdus bovienii]